MPRKLYLITVLIALSNIIIAQQKVAGQESANKNRDLIQFSGIVVEGDSLRPVPYTSIIVKNGHHGTISDYFGYFSLVAQKSDTIEFSAIGFGSARYIIPDSLTSKTYSLIQVLRTDTVFLGVAEIFPWPSKEQFKHAFLNLSLPDNDMTRAEKNMELTDKKVQMVGMAMDATANYKNTQQQYQSKLYYAGQFPSYSLLNPIAWAKFIQAWKNGDFSSKNNTNTQ